jgi:hypothetical protein
VYVWVDGVQFNVRLEDDRLCTLVMIGVRPDGTMRMDRNAIRRVSISTKLRPSMLS